MSIFEKYPDLADSAYVEGYDLENTYTATHCDGPILDLDVAVSLIVRKGNITRVAADIKRSRRVAETYITRNMQLQELQDDLYESFVDMAEEKAKELALLGDGSQLRFILGTLGKKRGYVTRQEVTGKDGVDLNVMFYLPENGREVVESSEEGNGA